MSPVQPRMAARFKFRAVSMHYDSQGCVFVRSVLTSSFCSAVNTCAVIGRCHRRSNSSTLNSGISTTRRGFFLHPRCSRDGTTPYSFLCWSSRCASDCTTAARAANRTRRRSFSWPTETWTCCRCHSRCSLPSCRPSPCSGLRPRYTCSGHSTGWCGSDTS